MAKIQSIFQIERSQKSVKKHQLYHVFDSKNI